MYLVIHGLTDVVLRPKVVNVQGGGYNICDGDDDAEMTLFLVEYQTDPENQVSNDKLRDYNVSVQVVCDAADIVDDGIKRVAGKHYYSLGFSKKKHSSELPVSRHTLQIPSCLAISQCQKRELE
jgi:hypothetical protein